MVQEDDKFLRYVINELFFMNSFRAIIIASTLTYSVSGDTTSFQDTPLEALPVEVIARMPSHTVLMYFLEMDIKECSYECAKHLDCMTINYNFKQRICELVDSVFDKYEADYDTKDWINIGVPKSKLLFPLLFQRCRKK